MPRSFRTLRVQMAPHVNYIEDVYVTVLRKIIDRILGRAGRILIQVTTNGDDIEDVDYAVAVNIARHA